VIKKVVPLDFYLELRSYEHASVVLRIHLYEIDHSSDFTFDNSSNTLLGPMPAVSTCCSGSEGQSAYRKKVQNKTNGLVGLHFWDTLGSEMAGQ
jgi:hypothetical protein